MALFLRQSGLYEQFFALLRLALDLNLSTNKCKNILPQERDQQLLVEYEEVILKSGLPMNEIWLRIEKLRQNFYFLPCPENMTCSDPQRIVFNDDICNFLFPLAKRENTFRLVIEILKLLKLPIIIDGDRVFTEFDDIEKVLGTFLEMSLIAEKSDRFNNILLEIVKELNVGPSYISNQIGWEVYLDVVREMLFQLSECFEDILQRNVILTIWFRLERLIVMMDRIPDKMNPDKMKAVKSRIKNLLKKDEYRNETVLYVEYGILEYIAGNLKNSENIFLASIAQNDGVENKSAIYYSYISWIEVLIRENNKEKAIKLLLILGLKLPIENLDEMIITEPKKLSALKQFEDRITKLIFIEKNVEILELEQYFLPDYFTNLSKAHIYFLMLIKSSRSALSEIEKLIRIFPEKNDRHRFLRERFYELYIKVADASSCNFKMSILQSALDEFPSNFSILRFVSTLNSQIWMKIRNLLTSSTSTPLSIIFLFASARYRFKLMHNQNALSLLSSDIDMNESAFKVRVVNLLKTVTSKSSKLAKNPLLWRLYLRSLFSVEEKLENCKNVLFSALDECPWNKALYMDGAIFVPHELAQLQDLVIEKQLRIYALPEELEILRSDNV